MSKTAVAYYRTSSAANVGTDKDSLLRQQSAVQAYAKANGIEIVREFYDAAVSGADPIQERKGFADLLGYIAGNGARTILCETASRFARDLAVQLTGHAMLRDLGYELVPVDAPNHFTDDTPTAQMVRSILGAVSEFQKAELVSKLRVARKRKKEATGKCEGRKSYKELNPILVQEAKRLRRRNPVSKKRLPLTAVGAKLAELGYVANNGKAFTATQVARLLA